jgi:hypothetical protein
MSQTRPIRGDREVNLALHVWLDAPGIWDELLHITDPDAGFSEELRAAAEYMMTRTPNEIELIGWDVLEDDNIWNAINASLRESIVKMARDLKLAESSVVSSTRVQDEA